MTLSTLRQMTLTKRQSQLAGTENDAADFEALFEEHWKRLCAILMQMLGDPQEAEDLALEAYVQLYRRPPAERHNLGGWLYRVAINLGLNALRAGKRRQHYEEQAGSLALEDNSPEDPAEAAERKMERQRVRDTLGSMKPRSAQVLILRHSGLSYAEMAGTLGVSPGSIGTLLARSEKEFEELYGKG